MRPTFQNIDCFNTVWTTSALRIPNDTVEASNVINDPICNKGPKCNNFWP